MKILLVDIETAPNLAHVWGLWQQNVAINQIMESGYTLCWAAKWLGETNTMFSSRQNHSAVQMLNSIHSLLDEADAVISYNGVKFDIPTLNREFVVHNLPPPSPYRQIDLLQVVKKQFKFPSNKLDYVTQALGVGAKVKHIGHELWVRCIKGDEEAWAMMKEYNVNDVVILEQVYNRLKPWIKNHANAGLYQDNKEVCPNCGDVHIHKRGFAYTLTNKYQRMRCNNCGNWFRSTKAESAPGRKYVNIQ